MIRAFALAVGQLGDRRLLAVLAKSMAVTLAVFALLGVGLWYGTRAATDQLGGEFAALIALVAVILAMWTGFRAVAIAVLGLFADEVVAAVEAKHYPAALASARRVSFPRAAAMGLRSAARVVLVNLIALPVYVVLLVTGVGTAAAFFVVNGWLLGRDLAEMVASRHLPPATMRGWRETTGPGRFLLGLAATGLFVVPVINILAPLIGAAMATHWFHRREGGRA